MTVRMTATFFKFHTCINTLKLCYFPAPQTDDSDGTDDTVCMLPTYYGGNIDENSICG